jgi:hypothetical protein
MKRYPALSTAHQLQIAHDACLIAQDLDLAADPSRVYRREGFFRMSINKEKMLKRTLFLFNDLILLCQSERKKFIFLGYVPLSQCIVWDLTDGALEGGEYS